MARYEFIYIGIAPVGINSTLTRTPITSEDLEIIANSVLDSLDTERAYFGAGITKALSAKHAVDLAFSNFRDMTLKRRKEILSFFDPDLDDSIETNRNLFLHGTILAVYGSNRSKAIIDLSSWL